MNSDIQKAIEDLSPLVDDILKIDISRHISFATYEQKLKRGQGKRVKGMVLGAGTTCYGSKSFTVVNLLEFKQDLDNERIVSLKSSNSLYFYLQARNYGLDIDLSFKFAKLYYFGRIKMKDSSFK